MKKIRVKPGKPQSALGFGVGIVFVLIGVFMTIPVFGPFGILWTLVAVGITVMHGINAFSEKGVVSQEIYIENDTLSAPDAQADVESRLAKLRELYDRRVITAEEYEAQRAEIIKNI